MRTWQRYLVAFSLVVAAAALRAALLPGDDTVPYFAFYPAVLLCLFWCGTMPGILAILLALGFGTYFFGPPHGGAAIPFKAVVTGSAFLFASGLSLVLFTRLQRTTRRLAALNEALRTSERRSQALADNVPVSVAYFDSSHHILFANAAYRSIVGRAHVPRGEAARTYIGSAMDDEFAAHRARALAGERVQLTRVVRGQDGREQLREISYFPDRDASGAIVGVYGIGYDVTEREALTRELQRLHADLAAILDHIPARVTLWNPDGTNQYANRLAEATAGVPAGGLAGRHLRDVVGLHNYARVAGHFDAALRGVAQMFEDTMPGDDGAPAYSQVTYVPLVSDGRVLGVYALATDITDLRRSYERIRQLARRLETVREEEQRAISQTLHEGIAQDLFAAKLVTAHIESLARADDRLRPVVKELAELLTKCMVATRQVANDLRPASLSHAGLEGALRDHAAYFGELSRLRVDVRVEGPVPSLGEDARLILFRTVQEALTNVAKHAGATTVAVTLAGSADDVRVVVADDGRGLAPGALHKERSLGLLGLRERLAARGGELSVAGNVPCGTVVTATLPVTAP